MLLGVVKTCEWSKDFEAGVGENLGLTKAVDFIREEFGETERAVVDYVHTMLNIDDKQRECINTQDNPPANSKASKELEQLCYKQHHVGEQVVDGFCDIIFVAINGLYKFFRSRGYNHEESMKKTALAYNRVVVANDAKRQPDGSVKRENNKVVKPEGWKPPEFGDLL